MEDKPIDKDKYKAVIFAVAFLLVFGAGYVTGVQNTYYYVPKPENIDFSLFWDAREKLLENFVEPSKITDETVLYGAVKGMAEALGDPYTTFLVPEEAKIFQEDLSGSFGGIGAEIGIRRGRFTIISPLEGSPAKAAGLEPGDIILEVDGQDISEASFDKVINSIRGQKGTEVTLKIFREEWTDSRDFKIIRNIIKPTNIELSFLEDGKVAHIRIFSFDRNLSDNFKLIARQITQSKVEKIILDLRNNPGGFLDVSQDIAGWFLQPGELVLIEDFGSKEDQNIYKSEGTADLEDYPVVVLINEGSASASEIVAGALRDNRGVSLVGEKSFGKGSVQTVVKLKNNSLLKITVAKWLTPKGHSISENGLTPDFEIENPASNLNTEEQPEDLQLQKALEIINNLP